MTLLVASVAVTRCTELAKAVQRAEAGGADAFELRLDRFHDGGRTLNDFCRRHTGKKWILTCRSQAEGGESTADAGERLSLLLSAAAGTNAAIDVELADVLASDSIRRSIVLAANPDRGSGRTWIVSCHDSESCPSHLGSWVESLRHLPIDGVAKVAYRARHINESFAALDLLHERGARTIAIAMGEEGLWSRILARKLGAYATFGSIDADSTTAPGQLSIQCMVDRFRWHKLTPHTRVYGVIGDPVAHSMSPLIFNRWFDEHDLDAVYVPLRVGGGAGETARFLDLCMDRPWLDIGGFSVTIPHKKHVLRRVGDRADSMARAIGAANTLTFRNGGVQAYNTDCYAAVSSIARALDCDRPDLAGFPVDLLGNGGAARGVLHGLHELGCRVTVYGRNAERTRTLAKDYGVEPRPWSDRAHRRGKLLINATSLGMWPRVDESPMEPGTLTGCRLVFDLIYNPLTTRLLRDAAQVGVGTLNGLDMFVRQAAMQFELWTAQVPDQSAARDWVERRLANPNEDRTT